PGRDPIRGPGDHARADRPDRGAGYLALSGGAADLRPAERAREPAAGRGPARRPGSARRPGARLRAVPAPERAAEPGRPHALRRWATDAGDRPRADEPAAAVAAG